MAKVSTVYGAIEGEKILITGQNIRHIGRPTLRNEKPAFEVQVTIQGESQIIEELEPKKSLIDEKAMLDKGDSISGKHLWGFSRKPVRLGDIKKGGPGRTSSHSGQNLTIKGSSYMIIIQGHTGSAIEKHPKNVLT